ncbi:MAG TPA: hypothetical protein VNK92_07215, partial [Vicinamibacterales bacterium]|nr:hypothetical protein [Vicinamibacterales bacterium]
MTSRTPANANGLDDPAAPVLEIAGLRKDYRALRPLRIARLVVRRGERVALAGLDALAAEVLTALVTGASLPDAGEIRVLGRSTAAIPGGDAWLDWLDRFGLVSPRAPLPEALTLLQAIALPLTIGVDPVADDVRREVEALAAEAGLDAARLVRRAAEVDPETRLRAQMARAAAGSPILLLLEHPTA